MRRRYSHICVVVAAALTIIARLGAASAPPQTTSSGTITGKVTEAITGRALAGALVTSSTGSVAAMTGADGVYQVIVPAGTYSLTVSVQSHPFQTVFGVVVKSAGTTTVDFAVPLPVGTGVIMGHIRKAITNELLANVAVSVAPGGTATTTDSTGLYMLIMPAGTYSLTASASGYQSVSSFNIAVSIQAMATRDLVLSPQAISNGTLTGRVSNAASGVPISNATVTIAPGGTSTVTDASGRYTLSLPAGTYTVMVSATGYNNAASSGAIVSSQATTTRDIAMTLVLINGTLTGRVSDLASSVSIANAAVTLAPGGTSTVTDASGRYTFSLPAGTYTVMVSATGYDDASSAGAVVSSQGTTTRDIAMTRIHIDAVLDVLHSFMAGPEGASPAGSLVAGAGGNLYGTTHAGGTWSVGTVFTMTPAGVVTILHTFTGGVDGSDPSPLIQGSDGDFYGTTFYGGDSYGGTAFKITAAGTLTTLHPFSDSDGIFPRAALVQATDGDFYGTTSGGGAAGAGTAFRMTPAGTVTTLHSFSERVDGFRPSAALIQATDGNFYGTTAQGAAGFGAVFKMTPGGAVTLLHAFTGLTGSYPDAPLTQGADGSFYGTALYGGAGNCGTVFQVTSSGSFTVLHPFMRGSDGAFPDGGLRLAADGNFYGTTGSGGDADRGVAFRMTAAGAFTIVHAFVPGGEAVFPSGMLLQSAGGDFYGTSGGASSLGTVFSMTPSGTVTVLHAFLGGVDGTIPSARLRLAPDGTFYGTTSSGGTAGRGTIFQIASAGVVTTLHAFTGGTDGAIPTAPLLLATDGNLYGTTAEGGSFDSGTIFKMDPGGAVSILHSFNRSTDGAGPYAGLLQAADGDFYGTTNFGGALDVGTIFRMTPAGIVTVLHTFTGDADGANPSNEALIQATDGNLYGTTFYGGASGAGTIFRMAPDGTLTILHSFTWNDAWPNGIIQATDGNFYGTTLDDIYDYDGGSIFKMTPDGTVTILHSFSFFDADGTGPSAGLIEGSDGNFYGTTMLGPSGVEGGTIFRMTPGGTVTTLYSMTEAEGSYLYDAVIQGVDGFLYGTAGYGGAFNLGTTFRLRLSPPIETTANRMSWQIGQAQAAPVLDAAASITFDPPTAQIASPPSVISEARNSAPAAGPLPDPVVSRPAFVVGASLTFLPIVIAPPTPVAGSTNSPSSSSAPPATNDVGMPASPGRLPVSPVVVAPPVSTSAAVEKPSAPDVSSPPTSRSSKWEIEAFGSALFVSGLAHGAGTLPGAGAAFTTLTGQPSRRVSSWYFGDGARLLNQVNASMAVSSTITPLDAILGASAVHLDHAGGGGVRVSHVMTPRLTAELSVESSAVRVQLTNAGQSGLEASRASFMSAWQGLAAAGQFTGMTVTSASAQQRRDGRQLITTGAVSVALKKSGPVVPYVTMGGGLASSNSSGTLNASIAGDYRFLLGGVTPVHETDVVTIRYAATGHALVGVIGGGLKYSVSRHLGVRTDARALFNPIGFSTTLGSSPAIATLGPTGSGASLTNPGIQFSNDPSIGIRSNLSAPALVGFRAFDGTVITRQIRITTGLFWRF